MPLNITRGTNISHWLSQSDRRGAARRAWFSREDMDRLADWGFDHVRLPIDEAQMWEVGGRQEAEAFDLMDSALDWAEQAGLRAVIDLHILRSHFFNQATEPALFTDPAEAEHFAGLWRQLSARLSGRPNDFLAYELMNEPVATDAEDWNRVAMVAFGAVRETEPWRTVILGSNRWNSALTFDELRVPDDRCTILTFHFYLPMLVTHHRAHWCWEGQLYDGPIRYPGAPIHSGDLARVEEPARGRLAEVNRPYDRAAMIEDFSKPLAVSRRTGLPLYCGEFGVIHLTPEPARLAWYRDVIAAFNECGIGWANWDYKGDFGLVDGQGQSTGIAEVILGNT